MYAINLSRVLVDRAARDGHGARGGKAVCQSQTSSVATHPTRIRTGQLQRIR
jgi:hypothetical protein